MKELKEMELFDKLLETPENDLIKQAVADGRHPIGYHCYTTPLPLLEVGDFFPVRLRGTQVQSTEDGNFYMGAWLCSYSRTIVQALINGDYDFLDGLLGTLSCVQIQRAMQHEGLLDLDKKKDPFFYEIIDVPRKELDASTRREVAEIKRIAGELEKMYGVEMSDDALRKAIHEHNEFNALMRSIADMRLEDKPKITGTEWHKVMVASLVAPHYLLVEPLKALKKALEARTPDRTRKPRIMVVGSILDNPVYTELIEEQGCVVVGDRYCFGSMPGLEDITEEGDPWDAIVRHYLHNTQCPRMMEESVDRFDYVIDKVKEYKIDGVVFETMKFCDLWGYEALVNFRRIQAADVPAIRIEREYLLSGEGQFATRVQAFVESIRNKDLM